MSCGEPEPRAGGLPIDRKVRGAIARSGSQRVLVDAWQCPLQALGIVTQFGCESTRPQCDRAGHGRLHVRVAGERYRAFALPKRVERGSHGINASAEVQHGIAQIKSQSREHLVVAGAAEVEPPASLADTRSQEILERGLPILLLQ